MHLRLSKKHLEKGVLSAHPFISKRLVLMMGEVGLEQALLNADHQRRIEDLEKDVKQMKPIVYETASSVKQIQKSVEKMEQNSDKIKGYFLASAITVGISGLGGLVFFILEKSIGGN